MDKFVVSNKQNITQNLDKSITNEQKKFSQFASQKAKKKKKKIFNEIYYNIKILNKY